ncbi:hypothetical protein HPP92_004875 [Vanilla planifolia]|uniref:Glycylpeptide N-tetradecanoyltransferase n=1 Tax=Vanilla planifolia TaxID=51239 RepID=A0A835RKN1_VANPL|nr:hypothetical protein HPP92_005230 [Vanilla planifolia]KAG0493881.1 hypothetical protein HPP92_004875 [Vanilla planifolia]
MRINSSETTMPCTRHSFWETQPVLQYDEAGHPTFPEGPIFAPIPLSDVKQDSYNLPSQYEWSTIDIDDDATLANLHTFLSAHFDESPCALTFTYSAAFLRWLLRAPGHISSLHVAVRAKNSKNLVGFIAGVPISLRIKSATLRVAVANLLCIHQKLRHKRLAPVLIKELVRRAQLQGIWQGAYATYRDLPTPFCSSEWGERLLNPKKLVDLAYIEMNDRITTQLAVKMCRLPPAPETMGFRKMEPSDAAAVTRLLQEHLKRFGVAPLVDEHFVEHFLVPKEGVVDGYVVENPETKEVTDFCSFVIHTKAIEGKSRYSVLKFAILFYYAAFGTPVCKLIKDVLVVAKMGGFDIVRAHGVMGNDAFLHKLLFRALPDANPVNYYLYNYRLRLALEPHGLGLLLL